MTTCTRRHSHAAPALRTLAAAAVLWAALPALAAVTPFASRAALGATDSIAWGQLGADSTEITLLPTGVTSTNAASATVNNPSGSLWRFDEGGIAYTGNFQVGDALLSTFGTAGPLVVSFSTPVARVGAQIQSNTYGAFTGTLEAFGAGNVSLGSVLVVGTSSGAQDNSAPFLGLGSTAVNIASVHFSITGPQDLDFAINRLDLSVVAVPEPQAYALALAGMALVASVARRRHRASTTS